MAAELPGSRVFADGTPATGPDFEFDRIDARHWRQLLESKPQRRKLHHNPSAASVHSREAGRPWRRAGDAEIAAANEAAKPEMFRKRLRGWAVQTSKGLKTSFGVDVDASSIQSKLADAWRIRERLAAAEGTARAAADEAGARRDAIADDAADVLSAAEAANAALEAAREALGALRARRAAAEAEAAAGGSGKGGKAAKGGKGGKAAAEAEAAAAAEEEAAVGAVEAAEAAAAAAEAAAAPRRQELEAAEAAARRASEAADGVADGELRPGEGELLALLDAARGFRMAAALRALGLSDPREHDTRLV
ncbi:hypothetical protein FNF27_02184 [Cafeteria roenbergensis]|uniref:Uncharacterized protein n=1 Tax=Cafeteria roenbergensis TaxID=33653 RepID=A0A5A8EGY3_CAFRO|nr:hypothetical protein FNF27_02184 [Cafeteria roenbergensis]